jgi:two-component system nitrogen regulation response regulator GlnG
MPGENGIDLIPKIHRRRPELKVIVMSALNMLTTAVSATEKGATDFLPKPFDIDQMVNMVKAAFRQNLTLPPDQDNMERKSAPTTAVNKSFVIGQSRRMQEIYRTIARMTNSDLTVLITGESGTGKEVIARALHEFSSRKNDPFVAINMASIPRELIESELFGHEKGAFTGALQKVIGRFEQAGEGTLFLDEIGDMPFEAQTRLLRVLQEGEFTTIGGRKPVKMKARIIAATNKNLHIRMKQGLFREDLYYRLNVVPIHVPPLRERKEDIPELVQHFVAQTGSVKVFEKEAMWDMQAFSWSGNIRELESFVKRLVVMVASDVIDKDTLDAELHNVEKAYDHHHFKPELETLSETVRAMLHEYFAAHQGALPPRGLYDRILREVEKPLIERTLQVTKGNQIKAAEVLGINRNTLRKKIRELDIEVLR